MPSSFLPFKRVLLKVSGEVLMGNHVGSGIDFTLAERIASEICACVDLGIEMAIVVGGGNFFRGTTLSHAGIPRARADDMGMLATTLNAIALEQVFLRLGKTARVFSAVEMPKICERFTQRRATECLSAGEILLFAAGTGNPFFTTDTAAAVRALEIQANILLKGTSVDGIYTEDPKKNPMALKLQELSHDEVLQRGLQVMDAAALSLTAQGGMPIAVFSIRTPGALQEVVLGRGVCSMVR